MRLTPEQVSVCQRMFEKFAGGPLLDDDKKRAWTKLTAEQFCFLYGIHWGTKKSGPYNPQSTDVIAYDDNGRLIGWDIINGNSGLLQFNESEDMTGQIFIPVTGTNHLGEPNPGPEQPPPPDNSDEVLIQLAQLRDQLAQGFNSIESMLRQDSPVSMNWGMRGTVKGKQ